MKKLINDPADVVEEMLQGAVAIFPQIARLSGHHVLLRTDSEVVRERQVAVISGGGSGHEPAHAGFIGAGMLSAAVAGEVFTSPAVKEVYAAIHAAAGGQGALLVVKNYMGDRLNFGLAAEMARADGIPVEIVIVADDVALAATLDRESSRGIAGTVFVHKIAGAAAAAGLDLPQVATLARAVADDVATMGLALSAGTVPAVGKPGYDLGEDEIEIGLGIHGEPGVRRTRLRSADVLADEVVRTLLGARAFPSRSRAAVMINNLGSTTAMELAIFGRRVLEVLHAWNIVAERVYCGTFMTSLEAAGVSISILPVDEQRLRFLDAPTSAPAWPNAVNARPESRVYAAAGDAVAEPSRGTDSAAAPEVLAAIARACRAIVDGEERLTEMDRAVGDGDLGTNLARGARAILEQLERLSGANGGVLLQEAGRIAQDVIGGSSGPLYGILLLRAGTILNDEPGNWAEAVSEAVEAVSQLGGAKRGDRTMLDALIPFAQALRHGTPHSALAAAEDGARATASMTPRRGRSSYLGQRAIGHEDPGAAAVAIWLRAVIA
jgi:dihydroxyacetone kinase